MSDVTWFLAGDWDKGVWRRRANREGNKFTDFLAVGEACKAIALPTSEKEGWGWTIILTSHPGKLMLKIILNRLNPQAENIIAEEQSGYRAGRSTTEQIVNLRILREK